ncbi:hypothetical protein QJS04_geneDACA004522 [Acorus gramineus]|uniref:Di19 C-terminal domain-containing protein n=1 Tax=Acorus gramineus TaxID=55184 RepID=A0AAV9BV63_ACOGR|nr:hypothetical protein QJS04_geneDACA004522 [Acorus gramineus]
MLSLLKKELREGHLSFDGPPYVVPLTNSAPDPLLSSFIYNFPVVEAPKDVQPTTLDNSIPGDKISDEKAIESVEPGLSDKDQQEKAQSHDSMIKTNQFGDSSLSQEGISFCGNPSSLLFEKIKSNPKTSSDTKQTAVTTFSSSSIKDTD